ncbi:hypothetical protein [Oceanisphaera sp. IT1-181]|uniref:hypothetical protein n=1 Tax=Oceanisphaera sp. IT1-181 TaxID=3081199 RepID=UPI0029CA898C|nr:hypothetical protein [Oceanisphaera sp. IT1-181]
MVLKLTRFAAVWSLAIHISYARLLISRNLTQIQGVGEETASGTEQTASASRELSELVAGLQQLVQGFRLESEGRGSRYRG